MSVTANFYIIHICTLFTDNQGNKWHVAHVQIRSSDISEASSFRVLIDAYRGSSVFSDIAIDDVKIKAGPCYDTTGKVK